MATKPMRLYHVQFKKGLHGTRIIHEEWVRATDRLDACERCRRKAQELSVFRLTASPVADDHQEQQRLARETVARCRKARR